MDPDLKLSTRLKIKILRRLAKAFGIPVTIQEHALPEVLRASIRRYVAECSYLLEAVYDQPIGTTWKFQEYALDHMLGDMFNPELLHDHPLYYAGDYIGVSNFEVVDGMFDTSRRNPALVDAEERFRKLAADPDYKKKWRGIFGFKCQNTTPASPSEPVRGT